MRDKIKKLKIHCFQHVPFEGPAIIHDWAVAKNHKFTFTKFFEEYTVPKLTEIDLLLVMGGPMGFDEDDKYPWLNDEILFLKSAIRANKAVIGICLGAQLIIKALGGTAKHGNEKEIGWFPVTFNKNAITQAGFNFLPEEMVVFHWHGDTFNIPKGALHLASSKAYPNQAFLYKDRVLGLQFHFEMDEKAIQSIIENPGNELVKSRYVQSIKEIIKYSYHIEQNNKMMKMILDKIEKNYLENNFKNI